MLAELAQILALDGLWLILIAAAVAGLVRGYTGFGTNIVFLPVAAQVLDPVPAMLVLLVMDALGPVPALPKAWRDGTPPEIARLVLGASVGAVLGVAILTQLPQETFRYAVSIVGLVVLVILVSGLRYPRPVGPRTTLGIGGLAGLLGGAVAAPGPVVIFFYMARPLTIAAIRANILVFLFALDLALLTVFGLRGLISLQPVLIGLLVLPVYLGMLMLGTALFDPRRETVYRWVGYAIIAGSALRGLPIWD